MTGKRTKRNKIEAKIKAMLEDGCTLDRAQKNTNAPMTLVEDVANKIGWSSSWIYKIQESDKDIVQSLEDGLSLTEIEKKLKKSYVAIKRIANIIGWDVSWRNKKDKYQMHKKKYDKIYNLIVNEYKTLQEVGNKFGISRERVRQILVDMGVSIRDLKFEEDMEIKEDLYKLLITGNYNLHEAADELDVSYCVVDRVMKTFEPSEINEYREKFITQQFYATKQEYQEKMKIALEMWDTDVETEEIAYEMGITRAYLNQLIIKCRKQYSWFPAKYAARFEPMKESEVINKLIIKDRMKRDPEFAKIERAKAKLAKEELAKAKSEKAREKARKAKEKSKAKKTASTENNFGAELS